MNDTGMRSVEEQRQQLMKVADTMMQGAARMFEMQVSAARAFIENQSRTASLFRGPEASASGAKGEPADVYAAGSKQMLALMQQTNEAVSEMQRQIMQLVESQRDWLTEQMRRSMEEFNRQATESLQRWREASLMPRSDVQRPAPTAEASGEAPSIVVSGLEGTRAEPRHDERTKATVKR